MDKSIIYYTHNRLDKDIMEKCQKQLLKTGLPIISVSLHPINFGKNVVMVQKEPSIITMYQQIVAGLNHCQTETAFFCEHDVLYHESHFDFTPQNPEVYYYNVNVWRWRYPENFFITYNHLVSLSGLCGNRNHILRHYRHRLDLAKTKGWEDGRNPGWARKIGHEPGKEVSRGGILDEPFEEYRASHPNLDLRHGGNLTPEKMTLESFRRKPTGWREGTFDNSITGWKRSELWEYP